MLLVVILLSLIVMVFGNALVNGIIRTIPQTEPFFDFLLHFRLLNQKISCRWPKSSVTE